MTIVRGEHALLAALSGASGLDGFLEDQWGREAHVVRGWDDPIGLSLTLADFDRLIASTNLRWPFFRVFHSGRLVDPSAVTYDRQVGPNLDQGLARLDVLYRRFSEGCTLVLQAMERFWDPAACVSAALGRSLGCPVQVYGYVTPPDSSGPPAHYDTHDVFVIQTAGTKRWEVWPREGLPPHRLSDELYDPAVAESVTRARASVEVVLCEGDVLYIPRGCVHRARSEGQPSLHLSVGVMVHRYVDVIEKALSVALGCPRTSARWSVAIRGRRAEEADVHACRTELDAVAASVDLDRAVERLDAQSEWGHLRGSLLERLEAL